MLRVNNFHMAVDSDITSGNHTWASGIQWTVVSSRPSITANTFEVEEDFHHVLLYTLNGAVFVFYTFDFRFNNGAT